ncbi:MAG: NADH-quinone oxidoreductase subunit C [Bacteroidetes bacterium]|nr:NADH-quinone oxidoreductase subunit C [Bacteroidota bacterium]
MENNKLQELIQTYLPGAEIVISKQFLTVTVDKLNLYESAKKLKESEETRFDFLFCESAVDFNDHFMMVYHLDSTIHRHQIVLKAKIADRDYPEIDSVYDIWNAAEYHEREIFDLFGISFINHPNLRKIFLDNDWAGFPMRKDYVDPVNIVER